MPLPFPYTSPTASQSQIRQKAKLLVSVIKFATPGVAFFPLRGGPGAYYSNVTPSTNNATYVIDFLQVLRDYISALVSYKNQAVKLGDLSINSIGLLYNVTGAPATSINLALYQSEPNFSSNGMKATALVAAANLPAALAANMVLNTLSPANPATLIDNPASLVAELIVTTPAGCTVSLYGMVLDFNISR